MTVAELVAKLQGFSPDLTVWIDAESDGEFTVATAKDVVLDIEGDVVIEG